MLERIVQLVKDIVGNDEIDISLNSSLKEDIGMNSYERVQLTGLLEDEFGVSISSKQMRQFNKIQDIVDYLQSC